MKKILGDRVLIKKYILESKNSIIDIAPLPNESGGSVPITGKVVSVGKLVVDVVEEDVVYFKESDSQLITIDGNEFLILREFDIIGIY